MEAQVGDRLVVESHHVGNPRREGKVLEVLGEPPRLHYRVQWGDGTETEFFPGSDARVVRRR